MLYLGAGALWLVRSGFAKLSQPLLLVLNRNKNLATLSLDSGVLGLHKSRVFSL